MVFPQAVATMGIHRVTSFVASDYVTLEVPADLGLLHHYRWYSPGVPSRNDTHIVRFAPQIVQRVKATLEEMHLKV